MFGNLPNFAAMLGLPLGGGETPLKFVNLKKPDRRDLPNGSELFAIGGQVKNPTGQRQSVPDIRAELRDASDRLVYSWTIKPDQRTIAPGGSLNFDSAKLDVFAGEAARRRSGEALFELRVRPPRDYPELIAASVQQG